jgi:hypothetical protein
MRSDFRIGSGSERLLKNLKGFVHIAATEFHPPQTVGDERVVGRETQCFFDQSLGFIQSQLAVCQRVTQGVVGVMVVRLSADDASEQLLHFLQPIQLFGGHREFIGEVVVVGLTFQGIGQKLVDLRMLLEFPQQLDFIEQTRAFFLVGLGGQGRDQLTRFVQPTFASQQVGALKLYPCQIGAVLNFGQPGLGLCFVLLFKGQLSQPQIGLIQIACGGRIRGLGQFQKLQPGFQHGARPATTSRWKIPGRTQSGPEVVPGPG